jgi:hypothetical protein
MNRSLEQLDHCPDIATLRGRLNSLFIHFGAVARLDIIDMVQAGRRQAMCFLRMESADQEKRLARELGLGRFGGDMVVIVDLAMKQAANDGNRPALAA